MNTIDTDATTQTLEWIAAIYEPGDIVEFRALPPVRGAARPLMYWAKAGEAKRLLPRLAMANTEGRLGIYAGPNPRKSDGGTTADDVLLARCLFCDWDGVDAGQVAGIVAAAGLPPPTVVVASGHGGHAYWRLTAPVTDLGLWSAAQAKLIGTFAAGASPCDKVIKDPPRVMRVPGFLNLADPSKDEADEDATLVECHPSRVYTLESLVGKVVAPAKRAPTPPPAEGSIEQELHALQAGIALRHISAARADDYETWVKVGMALRWASPGLLAAWESWSAGSGKWKQGECAAKWDTFKPRENGVTLGTLMMLAREDGGEKFLAEMRGPDVVVTAMDAMRGAGRTESLRSANEATPALTSPPPPSTLTSPPPTPAEPAPRDDDAGGGGGGRPRVSNVIDTTYLDDEGKERDVSHYKPFPLILSEVAAATGGWPRRAGGQLFAPTDFHADIPDGRCIQFLKRPDDAFAYLGRTCDLRWGSGTVTHPTTKEKLSPPSKGEMFAYLMDNATPRYDGIEFLPHVPPRPDIYYHPCKLPLPDLSGSSPLQALVCRFNAESEADRLLMLAAMMTPGWGGAPGARPAFVFTSDHGRGVGKTTTAEVLASVWGGTVGMSQNEEIDRLRSRLLDDSALSKRVVLIDNVKGRLDNGELESLITCGVVDGKKMYVGQASRPNLLTWMVTVNSPHLSADLAERSVVIRVGAGRHAENYRQWAAEHIERHRPEILAELIHLLSRASRCVIDPTNRDRWQGWQDGVLAKMDNGDELARLIKSRREAVNADSMDAEEIRAAVDSLLSENFPADASERRVFITRQQLQNRMLKQGTIDTKFSARAFTTWVRDKVGTGVLSQIKEVKYQGTRGWMWYGEDSDPQTSVSHLAVFSGDEEPEGGGW